MDASDLNIRIAKLNGWDLVGGHNFKRELPNWSGSLDLMHELEGELSDEEWQRYDLHLLQIIMQAENDWTRTKARLHVSAAQKAEAYCRTKERS